MVRPTIPLCSEEIGVLHCIQLYSKNHIPVLAGAHKKRLFKI